jgi:hypothetical protein
VAIRPNHDHSMRSWTIILMIQYPRLPMPARHCSPSGFRSHSMKRAEYEDMIGSKSVSYHALSLSPSQLNRQILNTNNLAVSGSSIPLTPSSPIPLNSALTFHLVPVLLPTSSHSCWKLETSCRNSSRRPQVTTSRVLGPGFVVALCLPKITCGS